MSGWTWFHQASTATTYTWSPSWSGGHFWAELVDWPEVDGEATP